MLRIPRISGRLLLASILVLLLAGVMSGAVAARESAPSQDPAVIPGDDGTPFEEPETPTPGGVDPPRVMYQPGAEIHAGPGSTGAVIAPAAATGRPADGRVSSGEAARHPYWMFRIWMLVRTLF